MRFCAEQLICLATREEVGMVIHTYVGCGYGCNSAPAWFRLYPHRLRRRGLFGCELAYTPEQRDIEHDLVVMKWYGKVKG